MTTLFSRLQNLGFDAPECQRFTQGPEPLQGSCESESARSSAYWASGLALLNRLPPKSKRNAPEQDAAQAILQDCRAHREAYLHWHVQTLYKKITADLSRFLRLGRASANHGPGFDPVKSDLARRA